MVVCTYSECGNEWNDVIYRHVIIMCDSHGVGGGGGNIEVGHIEGPPCLLNVFQAELMSPTRSERCARCMYHVCTYKPAPLAVLLATVVTHSEPVLPGVLCIYSVQCICIELLIFTCSTADM